MALKPRTATVVIYQGDDLERLAELRRVAENAARIHAEAVRSPNARAGDDTLTPKLEAEAAYDAFVEVAAERAESLALRNLGGRQWRDLIAEHPPRRVVRTIDGQEQDLLHEDDADFNVNTSTLPDVLLRYVNPNRAEMRTITSPEFPTAQDLQNYLDDISGGDYDRLFVTAFHLNASPGYDPKASTYSSTSPPLSVIGE